MDRDAQALIDVLTGAKPAPPCIFVLFGATGDLAARKIAPALYNLNRHGLLDERLTVLGVARRPRTDEQFRQEMQEAVRTHSTQQPIDEAAWTKFAGRWHYHVTHADSPDEYATLAQRLSELQRRHGTGGSRVFHLATVPEHFGAVVRNLAAAGLNRPTRADSFVRVVVEKPFGYDLPSSRKLNRVLGKAFDESQIFRIDHYLGKETVQNIMVLRFANAIFEPLLSRQFVDHVQITASETMGMEGRRGTYYETTGALRDMVQNHMLQLLALTAMEPPIDIDGEAIRDEKVKVLRAIAPPKPRDISAVTVRGQYVGGEGTAAYRQEQGVAADSDVETYVALRLTVDTWRWADVPFYLRTGKRLSKKVSQIIIVFKREPIDIYDRVGCDMRGPNRLVIRIYPDEGIHLVCDAKVPGVDMLMRPVQMKFAYGTAFGSAWPEAYEHLILDAIQGDAALFIRSDEVEAAWRFVDAIRAGWQHAETPPEPYAPGTWGPDQANALFGDPHKRWFEQ